MDILREQNPHGSVRDHLRTAVWKLLVHGPYRSKIWCPGLRLELILLLQQNIKRNSFTLRQLQPRGPMVELKSRIVVGIP